MQKLAFLPALSNYFFCDYDHAKKEFYGVNERKSCISLYGSLLGKAANEQIFQEVDPQKNIVDR